MCGECGGDALKLRMAGLLGNLCHVQKQFWKSCRVDQEYKLNHNILYSTFLWGYLWLPDQYFFLAVTPIILSALVCTCSSINRFPYLSRIITVHLWCVPKVPRKSLDKKILNYTTFTFKDFIFFYFWMPFMIKCSRGNKLSYLAPWTSTTLYNKLL